MSQPHASGQPCLSLSLGNNLPWGLQNIPTFIISLDLGKDHTSLLRAARCDLNHVEKNPL